MSKERKGVIERTHQYLKASSYRLHVHAALQDCGLRGGWQHKKKKTRKRRGKGGTGRIRNMISAYPEGAVGGKHT